MASSTWDRRITDEQKIELERLLTGFGLGRESLERPDMAERVTITVHVTPEIASYAQRLSDRYGLRSKTELARIVFLGWLVSADHPGRDKKPKIVR